MTNLVLETIKSRRSHRAFTPDHVKQEELAAVIEAGLYAPSAHNHQSWHFTVIQNPELIAQLNEAAKDILKAHKSEEMRKFGQNEQLHIFYHAPVVILVSGESNAMMPETDCAAATQNMLLAAESLGLGSCWIGFARFPFLGERKEEFLQKLQIPAGYTPYYAVVIGRTPTEKKESPERRTGTVTYLN